MENEKKTADAAAILFKRLYGVNPDTFKKMISILQREFDITPFYLRFFLITIPQTARRVFKRIFPYPGAAGKFYVRQAGTAGERIISDNRNAGGDADRGKTAAVVKCTVSDGRNTGREADRSEADATGKRTIPNRRNTGRNIDRGKTATIGKRPLR
jgi:hypothetical protein